MYYFDFPWEHNLFIYSFFFNPFVQCPIVLVIPTKNKHMIYRFRIVLDSEEDIFRDLELKSSRLSKTYTMHYSVFWFEGHEIATFYVTDDEWNRGEAIALRTCLRNLLD